MRRALAAAFAFLAFSGCDDGEGPIFPVENALYEWVTPELVDPRSDRSPVFADPVISFRLAPGDKRSILLIDREWRLGLRFLAGFDLRVAGDLPEKPVTLSRFVRRGPVEIEISSFQLDAQRGVTFRGRTCIEPGRLREWNRVETRIFLTDQENGFLEVFCNRTPLWGVARTRTTFRPPCRASEGCGQPGPRSATYQWQLGLLAPAPIRRGLQVDMQRIHQRILWYVPNRIAASAREGAVDR